MYTLRNSVAVLLVLATSALAQAEPIMNNRVGAVDIKVGDLPQLQTIFGNLFGSTAPNAMANQSNQASFTPTELTSFTILGAVAGYRDSNVFGIYAVGREDVTRVVFGSDVDHDFGDQVTGGFSSSAQRYNFGLFLEVYAANGNVCDLDYTVYSDDLRNLGQLPQALVFIGSGQTFNNAAYGLPKIGANNTFDTTDIIIAFEDLNRSGKYSDDDFNDLIVLIENVHFGDPVPPPSFQVNLPEPASLAVWSLIATVGGVVSWRRYRNAAPTRGNGA